MLISTSSVASCKCCFQILHLLHYSTASCATDSYANYVLDSFGFSHQQALSISTKLTRRRGNRVINSIFVKNANAVVALFRNLGFHDTLLRVIVSKQPQLLASNINNKLKPKFRALQDEDFSRSHVIQVISKHPEILLYGLGSTILPAIHILKQVMGSVDNVVDAIERFSKCHFRSVVRCLLPNGSLLTSYGFSIELIRKHMIYQPGFLLRNPEVYTAEAKMTHKRLGITRKLPMKLNGIRLISGMGEETFESKCQIYKSFVTNQLFSKYLVIYLGFSHRQALSTCIKLSQQRKKALDSIFFDNANSVVTFFQNHGFDYPLIRNIVSKEPRLIASNVNRTLKPKIRVLQDEDFSASDIIQVISNCPAILWLGMESSVLPAIHILKQVMGSVSNVVNAIKRFKKWHFRTIVRCLIPNLTLLSIYGIPNELIRNQLLHQPVHYVQNPKVFNDILMRVENKLGITRDSPMFLDGINLISGMTQESFESKCQILKSFGWTQSDVKTFIRKNGSSFAYSDECFKRKLDFLINKLQLNPASLTSRTGFITCSLERRIVPRHKILQILKEKGLVNKNLSLYAINQLSETCFLKRFVLPAKEVHEAYAKLTGCSLKMLTKKLQSAFPKADVYGNASSCAISRC